MYSFNGVYGFLAPTGAQEMLISGNHHLQRPEITTFICPSEPNLSGALNLHPFWLRFTSRALLEH